jgi:hypothetical protein
MPTERRDQRLLSECDHWRKKADEMRSLAAASREDVRRTGLLRASIEYDAIAENAEQRLREEKSAQGRLGGLAT